MAARRFLYVVAGLIMLTLAAALGWNLFQDQIMRAAFVPSARFSPGDAGPAPDYAGPAAWLSRPDLPNDPARWTPAGHRVAARPEIAVFYVAPTTYLDRRHWNAPLDDRESQERLRQFASTQASAFNGSGAIWAPRYRQATMGAFLAESADSTAALDLAYGDVARAFDVFLKGIPASRPILLAGHSQGSLHLMRLMRDRVAGTPLAARIVAAYLVGWPVSLTADLPALGLPACAGRADAGCILSWQSFAEPADPRLLRETFEAANGLAGLHRRGTAMLCINPLTGSPGTAALPTANLGALMPKERDDAGDLQAGLVPARCDPSGLLLIGAPPAGYGGAVLPGNNYHVFDYAMFWANIRADAARRVATHLAQ